MDALEAEMQACYAAYVQARAAHDRAEREALRCEVKYLTSKAQLYEAVVQSQEEEIRELRTVEEGTKLDEMTTHLSSIKLEERTPRSIRPFNRRRRTGHKAVNYKATAHDEEDEGRSAGQQATKRQRLARYKKLEVRIPERKME